VCVFASQCLCVVLSYGTMDVDDDVLQADESASDLVRQGGSLARAAKLSSARWWRWVAVASAIVLTIVLAAIYMPSHQCSPSSGAPVRYVGSLPGVPTETTGTTEHTQVTAAVQCPPAPAPVAAASNAGAAQCTLEPAKEAVFAVPPTTVALSPPSGASLPRVRYVGSTTLMRSDGVEPGATPKTPLTPRASLHAAHCQARYPWIADPMALPVPRWRENVFIAVNLHNSAGNGIADAMANEILRLVYPLSMAAPEGQPPRSSPDPSNVFISIYESGSSDATPSIIEKLGAQLKEHNIPGMLVWNGAVRKSDGHHIKNMARLRNAALKPMFDAIRKHRSSGGKEGWIADRVLFINDVFWCAEDALRLLDSGDGGHEHLSAAEREAIEAKDYLPDSAAHLRGRQQRAPGQRPHMVCAVDYKDGSRGVGIYDHWVFRDRYGQRVLQRPHPFMRDVFDQAAFGEARRSDVWHCWGGMVALDGEMFHKHGLTLRWRTEQCAASECSHLPADIGAVYGDDAWIQQDNMVATFYVGEVRDRFPSLPLYDIKKRMEQRERMKDKRASGDAAACVLEGNQDPETASVPPPTSECPALPYPLAPYGGQPAVEYPPRHWCCGEFGPVPVHWLNCRHVVQARWADWERKQMLEADFNPDAFFYVYHDQPNHIWLFHG